MLMIICGGFTGVSQDKLRRIEQPSLYQYPNTPVTVVVKLDDREMVDRKAIAGPDWLHKLSLDVTNTSRKNIKALRIDLILRDFQTSLPKKSSVLVSLELINSLQKTEMLLPGDCTTLKPPAEWIDRWVGYLKDQGEPEIEKIIIDTAQFEFTDGTMWFRGTLMRLDPETGRYYKVTEKE